jgi:hypothetical protein
MRLTAPQIRMVRFYLDHKNSPPTLGQFFRRAAKMLILWIAFCAAGCYLVYLVGQPYWGLLLVGLFVGAAVREYRHFHYTIQVWPALTEVLDWKKVEELAALSGEEGF